MEKEKQIEHYEIGPQHKGDSSFTAQMRFHQSWYRANVLCVPCGTGPGPKHTNKFGNMLNREDGARGLNFLTPEIFEVAKCRMEKEQGTVEKFRLLHHKNKETINPMDLSQWTFYVIATKQLEKIRPERKSVTLEKLKKLNPKACDFNSLKEGIEDASTVCNNMSACQ